MFLVISLKKVRTSVLAILLFLLVAAIITCIIRGKAPKETVPAANLTQASGPTLVIDAGHGGLDGGASAADGTLESTVNLQIAQRMELLAKLFAVPAVMTRTSEELDYPDESATIHAKKVWDQKTRIERINAADHGILISVHQNTFPDPRPSGTEVLYAKTSGSAEFAALTHENLIACLNPENRRVAAPISDSIYLMKQIRCPAVLVECGFLSNAAEAARLKSAEYQIRLSGVLIASYLQYIGQIRADHSDT